MITFKELEECPQFIRSIELQRDLGIAPLYVCSTLKLNLPHMMRNAKQVLKWIEENYPVWSPIYVSEEVCLDIVLA